MKKNISSKTVYLIYAGATSFFFSLVFTVSQIYRVETLNLNPLQLVLVGTVLETSCFIFEIPTGVLADIKSRKLSILIGLFLIGIAFTIEGTIPLYSAVIFSQFLWGLGYTFTSGADDAWIADELQEDELDSVYLRGAQVGQVFSLLGIFVSTIIGTKLINLPMIIGGIMFILLAGVLIIFMKETNFTPTPQSERSSWAQMGYTFTLGINYIKQNSILKLMLTISLLYGLFSEGFDRLWTAHFISGIGFPDLINLQPVVWVGLINGSAMVISIIVVEYIKKRMEQTGKLEKVWLLLIINIIMVIAIIIFGLSKNFSMALSMYMTFYITRIINDPIFTAWKNNNIKSELRATVLSTYGQMDAFGQIIGGPFIGLIATKTSIATAIMASGIVLSPILILLLYGLNITKYKIDYVSEDT